jgi:hypothetical protein
MLRILFSIVAACVLAGCAQVSAREDGAMRIALIPAASAGTANQERTAVRMAFAEANRRHAFGARQIILEEKFSQHDFAVIAGKASDDDDWAQQVAFLEIGRRSGAGTLQPMQSVYCTTPRAPACSTVVAARQAAFEKAFRDFAGEAPSAESYVAYAEAQSLVAAIRRLIAEDELTPRNVRRALVFGKFPTLLGDLRYTLPPDVIDDAPDDSNSLM